MANINQWRLCDELTVVQAVLLLLGRDPSEWPDQVEFHTVLNRPEGYDPTFAALKNAILAGNLPANIRHFAAPFGSWGYHLADQEMAEDAIGNRFVYNRDPSWDRTTVSVDALRTWLTNRGVADGFFFEGKEKRVAAPAYLDRKHDHYAPKLAAAIGAWQAVADGTQLRRSPKQALVTWLQQNAKQYGLTKSDGSPNNTGIADVAKVANWELRGGAPRTPKA